MLGLIFGDNCSTGNDVAVVAVFTHYHDPKSGDEFPPEEATSGDQDKHSELQATVSSCSDWYYWPETHQSSSFLQHVGSIFGKSNERKLDEMNAPLWSMLCSAMRLEASEEG